MDAGQAVIDAYFESFAAQKALADKAIAQLPEEMLRRAQPLGLDTNSVAVIMKHVAGNLRSRFTDFLTTDGEKPWRDRDGEFVDSYGSYDEVMMDWEAGWGVLFGALAGLMPDHLNHNVMIRGQTHSVPLALDRALAHTGYHAGQMVLTAKVLLGPDWRTVTVPRGGTGEFNRGLGYSA